MTDFLSDVSLPEIRIKTLEIMGVKSFEKVKFDFLDNNFICFVGPNGTGKSTMLEMIQMLFTRYNGKTKEQLNQYFKKSIRHVAGRYSSHNAQTEDFSIKAKIQWGGKEYEVELTKDGFKTDHPEEVKQWLYRLCYFSTLDKELNKFQLEKSKWNDFKAIFQTITGFEISEQPPVSYDSCTQEAVNEELKKYVFGFYVKKPHETVFYRDCSDGERKVMKAISSLLNMYPTPKIILIDNIEMHVEAKRHILLVNELKKTFKQSQIFSTTHSIKISKNRKFQREIYDLRWIHASALLKKQPWRMQMLDEMDELISKSDRCLYKIKGARIKKHLLENVDSQAVIDSVKKYARKIQDTYINDMVGTEVNEKIN
jgi:ABC-type oligopeptide transport system ATPase subunit